MRIAEKYLRFDHEVLIMAAYLAINAARLFITTAQVEEFNAFLTKWSALLLKYTDPNFHTPTVVRDMKILFRDFHAFVIGLRQQVKGGKGYELTGDDYANLFIHEDRERRGSIPQPTMTPTPVTTEQVHLITRLSGTEPSPGENHPGKPVDVHALGMALAYTAHDAPAPERSAYITHPSVGHNRFSVVSEPEQVGMRCWVICWYENFAGERGPESEPVSFIVI